MLDEYSDSEAIRAELIRAGVLTPAAQLEADEHPGRVVRLHQDGRGRRAAALTIWREERWLVSRLLREGPPWLRAELERLSRRRAA